MTEEQRAYLHPNLSRIAELIRECLRLSDEGRTYQEQHNIPEKELVELATQIAPDITSLL